MYEGRLQGYYSESELCGGAVTVSFSKVPPLASDALLTTLHTLLENVLQTVDHFEISCHGAPFSWLEKVDRWNPIRTSAIQSRSRSMRFLGFSSHEKELRGKKFRSDQRSAARFREVGGAL
jgi:hypothetical protein